MADTVFRNTTPPLKAVDLGDGTYAPAVYMFADIGGTDVVFRSALPAPKAKDLGDGTYALAVEVV